MITRLSDVLVVQALRAWLESDPAAGAGWLGALPDPPIGRAVELIHREPAPTWTVAPGRGHGGRARARLGYRSEAAFARAFNWVMGSLPEEVRRAARAA